MRIDLDDAVEASYEEADEDDASPEGWRLWKCHCLVFAKHFHCPADEREDETKIELAEGEDGRVGSGGEMTSCQNVDGEKDVRNDKEEDVHFQQAAGIAVHHEKNADEHDGDADEAVFVRLLFEEQIGEGGDENEIGGENAGRDSGIQTSGAQ